MLLLVLLAGAMLAASPVALATDPGQAQQANDPDGARGHEQPPSKSGQRAVLFVPRVILVPVRAALYVVTYPVRTLIGPLSSTGLFDRMWRGLGRDRYFIPTFLVDPDPGLNAGFRASHLSPFHRSGCVTYRLGYGGSQDFVTALTLRSRNRRKLGWSYRLTGKYEIIPDHNYFGIGNTALYKSRTYYTNERLLALGKVRYSPRPWMFWDVALSYHHNQLSRAAYVEPPDKSIEEGFPTEAEAPGLYNDPKKVWGEIALTLDGRNCPGRPTRGGLLEGYLGYARGVGDDEVNYVRYGGEGQAYLPLGRSSTLVLRAAGEEARTGGLAPIKLTELMRIGGRSSLRGYLEGRFRDNASVTGNAEYRYAFSPFIAATLFADFGKVMPRLLEFDFEDIHRSWGLGLRMAASQQFLCRAHLALSDECYVITATIEHAFDREDRRDRR